MTCSLVPIPARREFSKKSPTMLSQGVGDGLLLFATKKEESPKGQKADGGRFGD
jgi:hypothetical protein